MKSHSPEILELQYLVACHRDQQAYGRLFVHFYAPLTGFAFSIVKTKEGAEEVYSDVMMKLWDMGQEFTKIENLQVYLFAAVKNASLNYLSKYYKVSMVNLDAVDIDGLGYQRSGEEDYLAGELQHAITAAVQGLPTKCQLVYQLIKVHGFSYKQVAHIVGISVNTVEGHMTTALKKMAQALEPYLKPGRQ